MKALRRSIKGEKHDSRPRHISIEPTSDMSKAPLNKVIQAVEDYESVDPNFLSFRKGDFLDVSREYEKAYEARRADKGQNIYGLVPKGYFKDVQKTGRQSGASAVSSISTPQLPDSGYSTTGSHARSESTPRTPGHVRGQSMSRGAMVYGIVQYDFNAERPDELDAKAGEAIIVIAQSNPEWFVAKPIGRLGGPGLIPVSFIEVKDTVTGATVPDAQVAVQAAGIPKVEEWKKLTADYKNSSITLGRFEIGGANQQGQSQQNAARLSSGNGNMLQQRNEQNQDPGYPQQQQQQQQQQRQLLAPISASIPRYCFENDKYWYIIECVMEDGSHWELSRFYQNFYDFQIALLQQFPVEAATDGGTRILPFMPGPVTYVTDTISQGRRESLDDYVKRLLALPPYISRCQLVRQLFAPREGDFELDPNALQEDYRLSGTSQQSSSAPNSQNQSHDRLNGNNGYGQSQANQPWAQNAYQPHPSYSNNSMQSTNNQQQQQQQQQQGYGNDLMPPPGSSHGAGGGGGTLKIKVWFEDDCIAIRVPADIDFETLRDKLMDRLKVREQLLVQYKDEPSGGTRLMSCDEDLEVARQRNPRLQLYVGYAWDGQR